MHQIENNMSQKRVSGPDIGSNSSSGQGSTNIIP